jgi:restriction system protein
MTKQYLLVRSAKALINNDLIGIGWKNVRFTDYGSADELIKVGFKGKNDSLGRREKSVRRYFNLTKGDVVIVPVAGAIAIGVVGEEKCFSDDLAPKHSNNRTQVCFYKVKDKYFISRKELEHKLQKRLRVRSSIVDLQKFSGVIDDLIKSLEKGEMPTWDAGYQEDMERKVVSTKSELLVRIQKGVGTNLSAGGDGLERLVAEILSVQGYTCDIMSKKQSSGPDDIDITAFKTHPITCEEEILLVQVKHHDNITGWKGADQLDKHDVDESSSSITKLLVTSGIFGEKNKQKAEEVCIFVIDAKPFIDLVWENLPLLSEQTKIELGIADIPTLI